jgi:LuxR family transcriptional regulator, maltose regulon positive regulatory protein
MYRSLRGMRGCVSQMSTVVDEGFPSLGVGVVRRRRVTRLIEQAVSHPVTVLAAPAGSGKTVACTAWAGSADPAGSAGFASPTGTRRVGWLTLDETDNDPALLRARLDAVLPGKGVFVLDDVHLLAAGEALHELDRVISHAPTTLRFILSGRYMPGLRLARLRVAGAVADLGAVDLACTPGEADAVLAGRGAAGPAMRDELLGYTQGWITGLRLAALTGYGLGGAGLGLRANPLGGDRLGADRLVADYLRDEVLDGQPPDVRMFMLRTSVADHLTGEIADCITGGTGGARLLDTLDRENCFINRLSGGEYRYYPVFRDMLLAELSREYPVEVPMLKGRAAKCHGDRAATNRTGSRGGGISAPKAPLSRSELAVLRLLPSFLTNQEIADALFLSVNTVKTHLRSIYRKLSVSSRRQAIANGRRLQLL